MREIKFRARAKSNGEWVYGYFVKKANEALVYFESGVNIEVEPETVGGYIGLKDKNGKEIYEGDIVIRYLQKSSGNKKENPYDGIKFKVIYIDEYAAFHAESIPSPLYLYEFAKDGKWDGDNEKYLASDCEVIGNIYDNPELLKPNEQP